MDAIHTNLGGIPLGGSKESEAGNERNIGRVVLPQKFREDETDGARAISVSSGRNQRPPLHECLQSLLRGESRRGEHFPGDEMVHGVRLDDVVQVGEFCVVRVVKP